MDNFAEEIKDFFIDFAEPSTSHSSVEQNWGTGALR